MVIGGPGDVLAGTVQQGVEQLERVVDAVGAALRAAPSASTRRDARRLRHLQDQLASHALAARVLLASGASTASVRPVLERAEALLDEERRSGLVLR